MRQGMNFAVLAVVIVLSVSFLGTKSVHAAGTTGTWDANADFSIASNPNGPWRYLVNGGLMPTPLTNFQVTGIDAWWSGESEPDAAYVIHNSTSGDITLSNTIVAPPGMLTMDPESLSAAVAFTAPTAGTFSIQGQFTGQDTHGNPHPVSIVSNGVTLWTNTISTYGQSAIFNLTVTLNAGAVVTFNVATGTDPDCTYCYLATGFEAIVAPATVCSITTATLATMPRQPEAGSASTSTLSITSPTDMSQFSLNSNIFTATSPIIFQATLDPGACTTVSWKAALEYQTTSGNGAYSSTKSFSSDEGSKAPITYQSNGGKITVNANVTIGGVPVDAPPITIYVVGAEIPDTTITPELLSLYSGPTPRLLVGIADKESSYEQFRDLTLFDQDALWPNESKEDGGSHIGLMQMPVSGGGPDRIWSWTQNAIDGARWLTVEKFAIAKSLVAQIRKAHPTLPDLSAAQYEQYAVEIYGDHPGSRWSQQYWVPVQSDPKHPKSAWVWQLGTANPEGSAYVADVFSRVNSH